MLILFCALVLTSSPLDDSPRREPPSAAAIVHDLNYGKGKAHLLAYFTEEDDRPLYVEGALVAVQRGESWQLINAYRHPKDADAANASLWKQSIIYDLPDFVGTRTYDHKPSAAEVDQFLKDSEWTFKPGTGFHLIDKKVFSKTWKDALGYAPKYAFPKR